MPTKLERRLELLENLLIAGTAGGTAGYLGYQVGARGAAPAARAVAVTPVGRAALAGITYHQLRQEINERDREAFAAADTSPEAQEAYALAQRFRRYPSTGALSIQAAERIKKTRTVSKANKAVKHAMALLKAGNKGSTGADKGKLPKGAFKMATIAAGLANPVTPSKIGKGATRIKKLARKIRKWW
jgi:hypothetical protein